MKKSCLAILVSLVLLNAVLIVSAHATAIAISDLGFSNLQIVPESGTLEFLWDWEIEAFAEAKNSRGELDQDFDFSLFGGFVDADAAVTWASGHGEIAAPDYYPPDSDVSGYASTNVNCPGCDPKSASALGRGIATMWEFMIVDTAGTGTDQVNVDFSVDLEGGLLVSTDECGVFAKTDVIFGMELNDDIILFHQDSLAVGPNSFDSLSVYETLATTISLEYNVPYYLYLEVDSESEAAVVPEPGTIVLMLVGLGWLSFFRFRGQKIPHT